MHSFIKENCLTRFFFKANTDDTRESPAISIARELLENGANLYIHDPQVSESKISQVLGENKPNSNEGRWFF